MLKTLRATDASLCLQGGVGHDYLSNSKSGPSGTRAFDPDAIGRPGSQESRITGFQGPRIPGTQDSRVRSPESESDPDPVAHAHVHAHANTRTRTRTCMRTRTHHLHK